MELDSDINALVRGLFKQLFVIRQCVCNAYYVGIVRQGAISD